MRIISTVLIGIFLLISVLWVLSSQTSSYLSESISQQAETFHLTSLSEISPSPTPFLFQELTIPGLRSRSYDGRMGDLTVYQELTSYTSYLTWYDSDGLRIHGLLTIPKGPPPPQGWPAIVFVHGYIPPKQYRTTEKYLAHVDSLAKNGFVVFKIDLRGHGSSQGEATGSYYSADYVIDVLNAYTALKGMEGINPNGIGLWGHSMAGNVVMRSATAMKNIPAVVIWAGAGYTYQDLQTYRISDTSYQPPPQTTTPSQRRQKIRETYGDPLTPSASWFWHQMAPVYFLSDISSSIQIHHAKDDDVVSIQYSYDLVERIQKTPLIYEYHEYPSGGHNIIGSSFSRAIERTISFFHTHLTTKGGDLSE